VETLEQRRAQGKLIRRRSDDPCVVLFGRHVWGGAEHAPRYGQPRRKHALVVLARPGFAVVRADQTEVEHPHATMGIDHRVAGLEVAVDQPQTVGGSQSPTRIDACLHHATPSRSLTKPLGKTRALEQWHHDEHRGAACVPLVRTDVEDLDDVGVLDAGHRLRFASHALHPARSRALLGA